ncbi:MAG TPA: YdeI/OmpD-associated family protein, partial [Candidatus Saccharimonadia bacterium]|nr:YdeI/OmpD-associated family protein [Candidatus Saccharimonadia bacterium]
GSSYRGKGLVCAIGAFQKHVTLFFFRGVELADPDALFTDGQGNAEWRIAKFAALSEVKTRPVIALVKAAVKLDAEVARPARRKRPELPVPPVLAEALRGDPRARRFFESMPPSSRREFSEWIADAKQESTIQRRLEKAMTLLGEGMRLSDSYK